MFATGYVSGDSGDPDQPPTLPPKASATARKLSDRNELTTTQMLLAQSTSNDEAPRLPPKLENHSNEEINRRLGILPQTPQAVPRTRPIPDSPPALPPHAAVAQSPPLTPIQRPVLSPISPNMPMNGNTKKSLLAASPVKSSCSEVEVQNLKMPPLFDEQVQINDNDAETCDAVNTDQVNYNIVSSIAGGAQKLKEQRKLVNQEDIAVSQKHDSCTIKAGKLAMTNSIEAEIEVTSFSGRLPSSTSDCMAVEGHADTERTEKVSNKDILASSTKPDSIIPARVHKFDLPTSQEAKPSKLPTDLPLPNSGQVSILKNMVGDSIRFGPPRSVPKAPASPTPATTGASKSPVESGLSISLHQPKTKPQSSSSKGSPPSMFARRKTPPDLLRTEPLLDKRIPDSASNDNLREQLYDHPDGYSRGADSDDGLSDGGEFFEEPEFFRPSVQVMLKSVPIVHNAQHLMTKKVGYLFKYTSQHGTMSSMLSSQWQKRYVTLDSTSSLKYFSTNKSYVSKRVIPVCTMMNVEQDIKTGDIHPFRFKLTTIDRFYRFATDSADELALWTTMLMHAILETKSMYYDPDKFREGGDMHTPNKEGYAKMENVKGRRYLAVKRGLFCFYNNQKDYKVFSPIHQVELNIANVKDMGKCKIQLTTPQISFAFIFENQDEVNDWRAAFEAGISYALGDDKVMDDVYENPNNKVCADCKAIGPEWAAINYGVTLCQNCAGVHRKFDNAKVRSLRMDYRVWTTSLLQLMKVIGNKNSNEFWEYSLDERERPGCDDESGARKQFIERKYLQHVYCHKYLLQLNKSALNEMLWESVQKSDVLQTAKLVFSGADITYISRSISDNNYTTLYQMAEAYGQSLQMEFLRHNGADSARASVAVSDSNFQEVSKQLAFSYRWVILKNGTLTYHESDKTEQIKGTIDDKDMVSICSSSDRRMDCAFELGTRKLGVHSGRTFVFAADTQEMKQEWMTTLAHSFAPVSSSATLQINNFDYGGIVYFRQSTTEDWCQTWFHVNQKFLYVYLKDQDKWNEIDLRKANIIKYLPVSEKCQEVLDDVSPIFIDLSNRRAIYMQSDSKKETECWYSTLQRAITASGSDLHAQPISADHNIPIIVDKCIEFVNRYGLQLEGIYRKSGQDSVVTSLLNSFMSDTRSVCLKYEDFPNVHEIANVLKRFFRNLEDPLLTRRLYDKWIEAGSTDDESKLSNFKRIVAELPSLNQSTLKYLLFHLKRVIEEEAVNRMGSSNIATIFGPVLLNSDKAADDGRGFASISQESNVVRYLLDNYERIFQIREQDFERARLEQDARRRFERLASKEQNSPADMLLTFHVIDRDGEAVSLKVTTEMTASAVICTVIERVKLSDPCNWSLSEVICNEELERPIDGAELVIEIALRWMTWSTEFNKNNYFAIRPRTIHKNLEALAESHFAEWLAEDIIVYLGAQQKRTPPTKFGFTFITKHDVPSGPYFGRCVCFSSEKELYRWFGAILNSQVYFQLVSDVHM